MSNPQDNCAPIPPGKRGKTLRRRRYQILEMWYGRERAEVEISAHTSQVRPVDVLLDEVLGRIRRKENGIIINLKGQWEKIVGNMFARFTEPEMLKEGVLTLKVKHSALLVELRPSCDLIRQRINSICGEEVCREIRLRT
jgi:hypothetical protein